MASNQTLAEAIIELKADTKKFNADLAKVKTDVGKATDSASSSFSKLGPVLAATGAAIVAAFATKVIVDFSKEAIDAFSDFQSGMAEVGTLSEEVANNIDDFGDALIKVSEETGQPLDKLQKGLFDTISAGIPAANAIEFMGTASKLAVAGVTDVATSVDGLTSVINAYGLNADEASSVADKFFTAQKFGKTTVAELSANVGKLAPITSAAGVSMDEMFAALSRVTQAGISTDLATTSLVSVINSFLKPQAAAVESAKKLGIELNSQALASKGLAGVLEQVSKAEGSQVDVANALGITVEGLKGILAITSDELVGFNEILGGVEDSTGSVDGAYGAMSETIKQQSAIMGTSFEALQVAVGEALGASFSEILAKAIEFIQNFTKWVKANSAEIAVWGKRISSVVTLIADGLLPSLTNAANAQESLNTQLQRLEIAALAVDKSSDKYRLLQQQIERVKKEMQAAFFAAADSSKKTSDAADDAAKSHEDAADDIVDASDKATKEIDLNADRIAKAHEGAADRSLNAWGEAEEKRRIEDDKSFQNLFNNLLKAETEVKAKTDNMAQIWTDVGTSIKAIQTDFIVTALQGDLKTADDLWNAFKDNLATIFGTEISKIISASLTEHIFAEELKATASEVAALKAGVAWNLAMAAITLGITFLVMAIVQNFDAIKGFLIGLANGVLGIFEGIINGVIGLLNGLIMIVNDFIRGYNSTLGQVFGTVGQIGLIGEVNLQIDDISQTDQITGDVDATGGIAPGDVKSAGDAPISGGANSLTINVQGNLIGDEAGFREFTEKIGNELKTLRGLEMVESLA